MGHHPMQLVVPLSKGRLLILQGPIDDAVPVRPPSALFAPARLDEDVTALDQLLDMSLNGARVDGEIGGKPS